ncbi:hypothetical protein ACO2Q3_09275 [Caulobacter sp. KR2-114]|uniref:hypothetical protein n=1 Tax=Caulobacter sp. KR2-114 TaxID=3400912 RepID=UPI003C01EC8E
MAADAPDRAEIDTQRALCEAQPSMTALWNTLARMLIAADRPAEAMAAATAALAGAPGDATALNLRSAAEDAHAAVELRLRTLERAAAFDPGNAALQLELGETYADLDRPADAQRCLQQALRLSPGLVSAEARLAAVYLSVDIEAGAEHHALRALALQPGHIVASQTLAVVLERRGEGDAARALMARAYSRQSLFAQPAAESRMTVLVLASIESGNIPYRHLMPAQHYSRLIWYMEHAQPGDLARAGDFDLVFNTIGDPDLAGPSAGSVRAFLAGNAKPLLNDPALVMRTHRHEIPRLLGDIPGVVAPAAARAPAEEAGRLGLAGAAARHGLALPLLVRPVGSHGGKGLHRVQTEADWASIPALQGDVYLTCYHDYRSADGRWRKGRVIFVDGRPFPYHFAVADDWMVHYESAGMVGAADRLAEEARFLEDPAAVIGETGWAAIGEIGRRLGLHYGGVDFAPLADGRILVFEANATMLVHPEDPDGPLAYKNPAVQRIIDAFQAMLERMAQRD